MLGWPYVGLTLCQFDLMSGRPYVGLTLCRVDLMSGRPYFRSMFHLNHFRYFKVSTVVWCGGLGFQIELLWRNFFSILVPLFSTLGKIFNSIFWSHWSLFVSQHVFLCDYLTNWRLRWLPWFNSWMSDIIKKIWWHSENALKLSCDLYVDRHVLTTKMPNFKSFDKFVTRHPFRK